MSHDRNGSERAREPGRPNQDTPGVSRFPLTFSNVSQLASTRANFRMILKQSHNDTFVRIPLPLKLYVCRRSTYFAERMLPKALNVSDRFNPVTSSHLLKRLPSLVPLIAEHLAMSPSLTCCHASGVIVIR